MTEGLPIGTYNIIYADPPWRYDCKNVQGAAENHYSTMSIDELMMEDPAEQEEAPQREQGMQMGGLSC